MRKFSLWFCKIKSKKTASLYQDLLKLKQIFILNTKLYLRIFYTFFIFSEENFLYLSNLIHPDEFNWRAIKKIFKRENIYFYQLKQEYIWQRVSIKSINIVMIEMHKHCGHCLLFLQIFSRGINYLRFPRPYSRSVLPSFAIQRKVFSSKELDHLTISVKMYFKVIPFIQTFVGGCCLYIWIPLTKHFLKKLSLKRKKYKTRTEMN